MSTPELHDAFLETKPDVSVIEGLLAEYDAPTWAQTKDADGRLPIHLALQRSSRLFDDIDSAEPGAAEDLIRMLVEPFPDGLSVKDSKGYLLFTMQPKLRLSKLSSTSHLITLMVCMSKSSLLRSCQFICIANEIALVNRQV